MSDAVTHEDGTAHAAYLQGRRDAFELAEDLVWMAAEKVVTLARRSLSDTERAAIQIALRELAPIFRRWKEAAND